MFVRSFHLTAAFCLLIAGVAPATAENLDVIRITVDKASVTRIPEHTQTLVVGEPGIADVTMLKTPGMGVITGKGFGETNLIALDASGNLLGEWIIRVGAQNRGLLVQNGMERSSYICDPMCMPTVELSDTPNISKDRAAAIGAHSQFASGGR